MSEGHVTSSKPGYDKTPQEVRTALVREMNRAGVFRLEGEYSGGHDEGGLDGLTFYDKDGNVIDVSVEGKHMWEHPLHQAVEDLLSTKFYTWALEGYVNGQVYVDLGEKRAWTSGSEEVTQWEDDLYPIDMRW